MIKLPLDKLYHEALSGLAEELESALHAHTIEQDIRGWKEVSEVLKSIQALLNGTYFGSESMKREDETTR